MMAIWIVIALMTAAVVAALIWAWSRAGLSQSRAAFSRAVFRDQLAELDRDAARGAIGEAEAAAARNEVARRLIGEADSAVDAARPSSRLAPWLAAALIPLIAVPLYLYSGSPRLHDVPLEERLAAAIKSNDFEALVAKVEAHLASHPDDAKGWAVVAPAYKQLGRYQDAANAYANVLRLSTPTADLYTGLGQMIAVANQGLVTAEAAKAFDAALALDPKHPAARFFKGLGLKQEGKTEEALAIWQELLKDTPADAPWRTGLEREIADVTGVKAPELSQEQMAAAQNMSTGDRQAMIRSMVDGLEARLATNGDDLEGWQRLMRARVVLGETEKAKASYGKAREQFGKRPEALARLAATAKELRIE
jgi:cytochrome c-type biogenesis protein CcmH